MAAPAPYHSAPLLWPLLLGAHQAFFPPGSLFLYWLDPAGYELRLLPLTRAQPLGPIPSWLQTQSKASSSVPGTISTTFSFKEADVAPGNTQVVFSQNELKREGANPEVRGWHRKSTRRKYTQMLTMVTSGRRGKSFCFHGLDIFNSFPLRCIKVHPKVRMRNVDYRKEP